MTDLNRSHPAYERTVLVEELERDGVKNPSEFLNAFALRFMEKAEDVMEIVEEHIIREYGLEGIKADLDFYGIDKKDWWE